MTSNDNDTIVQRPKRYAKKGDGCLVRRHPEQLKVYSRRSPPREQEQGVAKYPVRWLTPSYDEMKLLDRRKGN